VKVCLVETSNSEMMSTGCDGGHFSHDDSLSASSCPCESLVRNARISRRHSTISGESLVRNARISSRHSTISDFRRSSTSSSRNPVIVGPQDDSDDHTIQDGKEFEKLVVDKVKDLDECKRLLTRTRAVTLMADRMKLAKEESECYEEVSKLLVALFGVERSSIALMDDFEHVRVLQMAVSRSELADAFKFSINDSGIILPLVGFSFGRCAETLQPVYAPDTRKSLFLDHQKIAGLGLHSVINAPLLIAGKKFLGCLNVASAELDAFTTNDQLLVKDIASCLASNVFTLRMQQSQREDAEVNERLLQAMIPNKVLARIDFFWRDRPEEDVGEASTTLSTVSDHMRLEEVRDQLDLVKGLNCTRTHPSGRSAETNVQLMAQPQRTLSDFPRQNWLDEDLADARPGKALYAEEKWNVSIIFSDIVGFSRISDGLKPIKVMDMLHDLFNRYDRLCEQHGVFKVETIGDGCVMAAGLLEDSSDNDSGKAAARRAIAIAKDMIREARKVPAPLRHKNDPVEYLEIRVGIHVGPTTCGVLGKVMPRFQVFGSAVNMAARMEQTSKPGMVHVSKAFYELIGDEEAFHDPRVVTVKNMGEQETWLLDPSRTADADKDAVCAGGFVRWFEQFSSCFTRPAVLCVNQCVSDPR